MKPQIMSNVHHDVAPWNVLMEARAVRTLRSGTEPRWLRVDEGCVWVTAQCGGPHSADHWLGAGQSLALPAGSAWVVQAWPQARLSLLLAPPPASRAAPTSRAWWRSSWIWPWLLAVGRRGRHLPA